MPDNASPNLTPKQRIAAGLVAACCALSVPVVAHFEGRVMKPYPDVVLGWKAATVCTGHMDPNLDRDRTFTQAECDELLAADMRDTFDILARDGCIGNVPLPDRELAAFLSLGFNLGAGAVCKGSIPRLLKEGRHAEACEFITRYRLVGGRDCAIASNNCRGIVRRREAERALCLGVT